MKKEINYALVEDKRPPLYTCMKYWGTQIGVVVSLKNDAIMGWGNYTLLKIAHS